MSTASRLLVFRSVLMSIAQRALARLLDAADRLVQYRRSFRLAFGMLLALVSVGVVLDYGAWQRETVSSGPFRAATGAPGLLAVDIGGSASPWFRVRLIDSNPFALPPSGLRLLQDGGTIELPATPRPQVAQGTKLFLGIRHREVTFALPNGVANDGRLSLTANYAVTYHRTFDDVVLACFVLILMLGLVIGRRYLEHMLTGVSKVASVPRFTDMRARIASAILPGFLLVSMLVIVACAGYAATIVYGVIAGDALPSATAFHLMPIGWLTGIEPYFPAAILIFAAAGTLVAWATSFRVLPVDAVRQTERLLERIWIWWGFPVITCLFLFSLSAGGWSGNIRLQDSNYLSLAGLAPYSDAREYFTDAYRAAFFGDWDLLGSRRPVAQAFRQLTVVAGGHSYVGTLLTQLFLIALALFVAARFVAGRSGIWAGIGFVGLIFLVTRPFLYTTMTEPLGLIWTLFSIVFLLEAFRLNSLPHALVGFAGLTLALITRMGSLFTIPFLAVWMAYSFETTWQGRARTFVLACGIVAAVLALNGILAFLYSSPLVATGSNFAYSFCGLSLGTDWSNCSQVYGTQLRALSDERSRAAYLFGVALQNIFAHPTILLVKLADNAFDYFRKFPEFLFSGYSPAYQAPATVAKIGALVLLVSLAAMYRVRGTRTEGAFWILVLLSSGMAAAVVLADDGWRALHVTNALIACFFAAGFSAPTVVLSRATAPPLCWQYGVGVIAAAAALFVVSPPISMALMSGGINKNLTAAPITDEIIIPGGRFITGFQVIPDGSKRPSSVPTLFVSEFTKLMQMTNLEGDFGQFVDLAVRRAPFALVVVGRLDSTAQSNILIAPASLLGQPDIIAWRLQVRRAPSGDVNWNDLREVVAAEPIRSFDWTKTRR